jgi:hypothetical protein
VPSQLLAVQIDVRQVVGRPEVNKQPGVGPALVVKTFLVPDRAFVKQQTVCLAIPVAGHAQRFRSVEIVLDQIALRFWFCILEIAVGARLVTIVVIAAFVRIDNGSPLTIETNGRSSLGVCNQINLLSLSD